MDWFEEAKKLYKPGVYGYRKIAKRFGISVKTVESRFLNAKKNGKISDGLNTKIQYNSDGTIVSEKFLKLQEGQYLTPNELLKLHGFDPALWHIISCTNNFWNSQLKGGTLQISYQSKLTVKPIKQGVTFEEIDKHFKTFDRTYKTPTITPIVREGHMIAELNIADLHLGKLCWHGDTPENYDYKIAKQTFYNIINEACNDLKDKPIEYITFVWCNDFFNCDTINQTTTAGTRQDVDVRWQKLFNVGVEMLVTCIDMLAQLAPVKTFYTPSNHDEVNGYHAMKYVEAWFRNDGRVEVNTDAYPRKYLLYGNTLIGYTHGDKENAKGTKDKASRLASLMPIEVPELWSKARYREFHAAHLHSEHMIEEINGVIVRRISSPTAADTYHTTYGYLGAVRKAQMFLYDKERGLMQLINIPV